MSIVEVNHQVLSNMAESIREYCDFQDSKMKSLDANVKIILKNGWSGTDAQAFETTWDQVNTQGSVSYSLNKSLNSFADAVEACASEYKKAQEQVYNLANGLPKYIHW